MANFVSERQQAARMKRAERGNDLANKSPAEVAQAVADGIKTLPDAKAMIVKLARIVAVHEARLDRLEAKSND